LVNYNVPAALVALLKPVYINYSGIEYVVMYNATTPYFVINTSSNSFVLNATSIYNIIRNYSINYTLAHTNFTLIASQMHRYLNSSSNQITDCLHETGLDTGLTCTLANHCQSCEAVPVCQAVLINTSGPTGVFGLGIMKFEKQYNLLNSSEASFFAALQGINRTNALLRISTAVADFDNISNVTRTLYQNPIFPPNNVTSSQIATCVNYPVLTSAPWFCSALGFCEGLTYNYSLLNVMSKEIQGLNALPISNQNIFSLAVSASQKEMLYLYPVLSKQRLAVLGHELNTTLASYNSTLQNAEQLLSHVSNSLLVSQLNLLVKSYSALVQNYMSENISEQANATAKLLGNVSKTYALLNSSYSSAVALAGNNTAKVLEAQLTNANQSGLAGLAFEELNLNSELAGSNISNITGIRASLLAVSHKLQHYSFSAFGLASIARAVDGPFLRPLAYSLHAPYSTAVALSPLLGTLFSLIIGIVIIFAFFFVRSYFKLHRRLVMNKRTARNWRILFELIVVVVVVYVVATYAVLAYANSYAPFSAFSSAVSHSHDLVIAINGTPTLNAYECASKIGVEATAMNKTPTLISIINGVCTVGNSTMNVSTCMNYYAVHNIPVIMLTNSSNFGISIYSLYGTVMNARGNATIQQACYPALLLG